MSKLMINSDPAILPCDGWINCAQNQEVKKIQQILRKNESLSRKNSLRPTLSFNHSQGSLAEVEKGTFISSPQFNQVDSNMKITRDKILGLFVSSNCFNHEKQSLPMTNDANDELVRNLWVEDIHFSHLMSKGRDPWVNEMAQNIRN